jgi:hypothetical protein
MTMPVEQPEKMYTYKELSDLYGVHVNTIANWFRYLPKFAPTRKTVLIPESTLHKFRAENIRITAKGDGTDKGQVKAEEAYRDGSGDRKRHQQKLRRSGHFVGAALS